MAYNPFDKPVREPLDARDLQQLVERSVAEGYYVEFKREPPSNDKIGHSLASLANSYGGWYIVGVETDEHNIAKDICGFDTGHIPDPISKVRDIARSHIDPTPVFF